MSVEDPRYAIDHLLEDDIHHSLETLHKALRKQFRDCKNGHLLNLKLDGFFHERNDSSNSCFDLFISAQHYCHPPTWVRMKAAFIRQLKQPLSDRALCSRISSAAERRLSVNMHLQQTRVRSPHSTAPEPRDTKNISRYMIALGPDGPATTIAPMRSLAQVFKLPNDFRWCSGSDLEPQIYFSRDPATGDLANITEALVSCHLDNEELSQEELELNGDMQLLHLAKVLMEVQLQEKICLKHGPKRMSLEKFRIKLVELAASTPYFTHRDNDFSVLVLCHGENYRTAESMGCLGKSRCTDRIQRKKTVNSREAVKVFYEELTKFHRKYLENIVDSHGAPEAPHLRRKIRVAIIDSGVSKEDLFIKQYMKRGSIAQMRNFTSPDINDCEDSSGHGTAVTKILLEVAPHVEVYIAKVTNTLEISSFGALCIAQAVNYAVQMWDVDIINMSLGLDAKEQDIDEALRHALQAELTSTSGKIVVAAAGTNRGANETPAWPGIMLGVIAIHATDGFGKLVNFNPPTQGIRFGTMGLNVKVEEESLNGDFEEFFVSGTSYATPVAAGFAANILEIVRHRFPDLTEARKMKAYSGACMEKIFGEMSVPVGDCKFVQPWSFWKHVVDGKCEWRGNFFPEEDEENMIELLGMMF
ncbi:hypothetical protein LMH87_009609 [Akanthomyces muscarius]|uniref:Peptidase S8/S53 domain-containing protein n=1 Tax=Akanthomyces muscarius TaxID=2231603 RepID=A0A9W8QEC1_AKAMU|nr:hypothetical protein LMH87_009609 [Akanthomyces muscarius]KAJ4153104.1 hypothetical protein LMH87_009609 [Akanthomyces muscarius]